MDASGQEPSPASRMQRAAARPPVGPSRDPLPEGVDLTALFDAVEAIRQGVQSPAPGTGGRAAVRRRILQTFPDVAEREAALVAALDHVVAAMLSLNHLIGSQSALLAEHEERLRAAEVRAREAELRAPLPRPS